MAEMEREKLQLKNMIKKLTNIEDRMEKLLKTRKLHSMYIDYHPPFVKRIWFQVGKLRVYLHRIDGCREDKPLFHPHPWKSAIRIIKGKYEMGVGHSETDKVPTTDCKLILPEGTIYEMVEENGWHYVNPSSESYSVMVTGERSKRKMPLEPKKDFRKLTTDECVDILRVVNQYYYLNMMPYDILKIASRIDNGEGHPAQKIIK